MIVRNLICIILVSISIIGCGFHLRGIGSDYKFPFKSVYLDCSGVAICPNLNTAIKTQNVSQLVTKPESAEVTLKLVDEETSRDAQGFTGVGRVSAYTLNYKITAQIWHNHSQIGKDVTVSSQSVMQYNDSTILSNTQNEVTFWDNLHQNVTNQLIRRLTFFKYPINDNESAN